MQLAWAHPYLLPVDSGSKCGQPASGPHHEEGSSAFWDFTLRFASKPLQRAMPTLATVNAPYRAVNISHRLARSLASSCSSLHFHTWSASIAGRSSPLPQPFGQRRLLLPSLDPIKIVDKIENRATTHTCYVTLHLLTLSAS